MIAFLPKQIANKSILLYGVALFMVSILFIHATIDLKWVLIGAFTVVGFFMLSNKWSISWQKWTDKRFVQTLFWTALVLRVAFIIFSYYFYIDQTGEPFEFSAADSKGYHIEGMWVADMMKNGSLKWYINTYMEGRYSDMGYPLYLGTIYAVFGKYVLCARLFKALFSALAVVLMYKLGKRNFGQQIGRLAAIMILLLPNLIYYCGIHTKEIEMVFLTICFMERADYLFRSRNFNFINIFTPLFVAAILFFFRTVLGATALMAMLTALVFSSTKVIGWGKRIMIGTWVLIVVSYFAGGQIYTEVEQTWQERNSEQQLNNLEWRSKRDGGNTLVKNLSRGVFAPLIFTIPFSTMVEIPDQENQQMMNGTNFVKNALSFFVILALYLMIITGKWRDHTLILAFTVGYLGVIALSAFAHSERFHMPALPFEVLIAAWGIAHMDNKKYMRWFNMWLVFIFIALIGWNWFKLAGRGMV